MKINTQTELKALDGKELKLTVGQAISNILASSQAGGKMKMFILAQKFYNDKSVDLDKADFDLVKSEVEENKQYITLVTGQLLLILNDIKDETKPTDTKTEEAPK